MKIKHLVGASALTLGGFGLVGTPVSAQPVTQEGLVNLNVSNVAVQVPVSVAANICDVNVVVLVDEFLDAPADCNAAATSEAYVESPDSGPVNQRGLINLSITDVAAQVPISVAANVCDVTVGVLVQDLRDGTANCEAEGISVGTVTVP